VIGAGLGGLAAAWLLGRQHQVTLFERQARPGFTAATVAVPGRGAAGNAVGVDVPLRVFYPGYYPTLTAIYQALAVPSEPVSYAASFARDSGALYFRYRNLRWGGQSIGVLAPQDLLLGAPAWRIVGGLLRFQRQAVAALHSGALAGLSIGDHVAAQGYPADFVDGFLLPAISTVCTCSFSHARAFPAEVIVDYLARGVARQSVHRALHGAHDVQRRFLQGIPDLRCNSDLVAVRRRGDAVWLRERSGAEQAFDHVVLATQANQALALLGDGATDSLEDGVQGGVEGGTADERAVLAGFTYAPVQVLTHTDAALLPTRRADWSPVNLWCSAAHDVAESTIWVNAVQPVLRGAPDVFQTVHPLRTPREGTVLGRAQFERPVVDSASQQALAGLARLLDQPGRRLWFCGSYAQAGIPLLESAARSAHEVARRLGAALPGVVTAST
jgi:predicted NAD/FAD-binding protein